MGRKANVKISRKTNPRIVNLILDLKSAGLDNEAPIWLAVSEKLANPSRNYPNVNMSKISRYAKDQEVILVPGKVLGAGELTCAVTVAALAFSAGAVEKIIAAGGKCLTVEEILEENPKGSGIRIFQ